MFLYSCSVWLYCSVAARSTFECLTDFGMNFKYTADSDTNSVTVDDGQFFHHSDGSIILLLTVSALPLHHMHYFEIIVPWTSPSSAKKMEFKVLFYFLSSHLVCLVNVASKARCIFKFEFRILFVLSTYTDKFTS